MGKSVTVATILTGLLLAGCSGEAEQQSPPSDDQSSSTTSPSTSTKSQSKRTAPAKSLQVTDKCSIITEQQWRALGGNQPPRARVSNGKQGCQYQKGEAGTDTGWLVFVAADSSRTMQEFAKTHPGGKTINMAGYPTYQSGSGAGCSIAVDVSDQGSLFVNGLTRQPGEAGPKPCSLFKKFAAAAVENLPNAEGA